MTRPRQPVMPPSWTQGVFSERPPRGRGLGVPVRWGLGSGPSGTMASSLRASLCGPFSSSFSPRLSCSVLLWFVLSGVLVFINTPWRSGPSKESTSNPARPSLTGRARWIGGSILPSSAHSSYVDLKSRGRRTLLYTRFIATVLYGARCRFSKGEYDESSPPSSTGNAGHLDITPRAPLFPAVRVCLRTCSGFGILLGDDFWNKFLYSGAVRTWKSSFVRPLVYAVTCLCVTTWD